MLGNPYTNSTNVLVGFLKCHLLLSSPTELSYNYEIYVRVNNRILSVKDTACMWIQLNKLSVYIIYYSSCIWLVSSSFLGTKDFRGA